MWLVVGTSCRLLTVKEVKKQLHCSCLVCMALTFVEINYRCLIVSFYLTFLLLDILAQFSL